MSTNLMDHVHMRGDLLVTVRDARTGVQVQRYAVRNKITFLTGDVLVELIAQRATDPAPLAGQVYSMRMGISNTPAARSDTNLGAFAAAKRLEDVHKVNGASGALQLLATLDASEGNGATLQEVGLFTRGNKPVPTESDAPGIGPGEVRMIAHQVHPPIPKTPAITVEYSWQIAFTA